MKIIRNILFGVTLVVVGSGITSAWGQYGSPRNRDWDRDGDRDDNGGSNDNRRSNNNSRWNNQAYQEGYQRGLFDAEHNHRIQYRFNRWKSDLDRRSYIAGYDSAYQQTRNRVYSGNNGGNRNPANGAYGRPGAGTFGMQSARQFGSQDGLNDGAKDRQTGHSFRPTQGDNYKNADRGYTSSYGSKDQYKQWYREAYSESYQRGYYGNGGARNGFYR
jgi:hypothetical protein